MSEIITDKLTGKTTAKTVTVTVGASATQSLEQGLIKAWGHSNHSANTIQDSFNIASITDDGTGLKDYNWTSSFGSADYVGTNGMGGNEGSTSNGRLSSVNGVWTSSQAIIKFSQSSSSAIDDVNALAMFIGDLA
tara:strand:+ start:332 stop:736 length:405 start_codon:yes stop_codon:yes gene_type:complete